MKYHDKQFPNESAEYRKARNELLELEVELRNRIEAITKKRSELPLGGKLKEDYSFISIDGPKKLSELFAHDKNSLVLYSFMFGPNMEKPCPACTSIIDTLNANVKHITDRVNLAVIAKSPLERIQQFAKSRDWHDITLLSSVDNNYNNDYLAENDKGDQLPALNVFVKKPDGVYHFYNTELLYANIDGHPRHVDSIWPIWNLFDMIPEGRGTDWFPKLAY